MWDDEATGLKAWGLDVHFSGGDRRTGEEFCVCIRQFWGLARQSDAAGSLSIGQCGWRDGTAAVPFRIEETRSQHCTAAGLNSRQELIAPYVLYSTVPLLSASYRIL